MDVIVSQKEGVDQNSAQPTILNEVLRGFDEDGMKFIRVARGEKDPSKAEGPGWQNRLLTRDQLELFFSSEDLNAGLLLGKVSGGIIDIDLDDYDAIVLAPRFLPSTRTFGRKSKRKSHYLYRIVGEVPKTAKFEQKDQGMLVEIRSDKCQTVYPGSLNPSGEVVEWDGDGTESITQISAEELVKAVRKLAAATLYVNNYPNEGSRHNATLALIGLLARSGWEKYETETFIKAVTEAGDEDASDLSKRLSAVKDTYDKLSRGENITGFPKLAEIIGEDIANLFCKWLGIGKQSSQTKPQNDEGLECTDVGNRNRFIRLHLDKARYVPDLNKWVMWNNKFWEIDGTETAGMTLAREVAKSIFDEAKVEESLQKMRQLGNHAVRSHNHSTLTRLLAQAQTSREIVAKLSDFDQDGMVLNVRNGTIDLQTGELRPHNREDLISKISPVAYDPDATAPRWKDFLKEVFDDNEELIAYVQRAVGYSMTGSLKEQSFFVLHGSGANGKGTFIDMILSAIGVDYIGNTGYALEASPEMILENKYGRDSLELLRLPGMRLVKMTEINPEHKLNQSLVKRITGEDAITTRALYKHCFSFMPSCKIWLIVNHRPRLDGTDYAMQRRIKEIPFNVQFDGSRRDNTLKEKLRAELPGILAWSVQGCLEWQKHGIGSCSAVEDATNDYIRENDPIAEFLEESCEVGVGLTTPVSELHAAYQTWSEVNRKHKYSVKVFTQLLHKKGIESSLENLMKDGRRTTHRVYKGVALQPSIGEASIFPFAVAA